MKTLYTVNTSAKVLRLRIWHDLYSIQFNFKYISLDREMYVLFLIYILEAIY